MTGSSTSPLSALAVFLPEVDAYVAQWRKKHDPSGRAGIPAHVTVLVPFVAPVRLRREVVTALGDLFATVPAFPVAFRRTARFPNALWLAPEPHENFVALTKAVYARWPEHPPYEGAYEHVIPHCTVAYELDEPEYLQIETSLQGVLPLETRAAAVELLKGTNDTGWTHLETFPLSGA